MTMELKKRVALVTGGGAGIGQAAALRLAQDGFAIGVADFNLPEAKETARLIQASDGEATAFFVDVTRKTSVDQLFDALLEKYQAIHCFLAAAEVRKFGDFLGYSLENWRETMGVNVDGTILCCQRAVKEMLRQGTQAGPYSVLLSMSDAACLQDGNKAAYCASGWALRGFMRHLALNLGTHNILVNALAQDDSQAPDYLAPAATVSFLFSDEARNITGMTLLDNGGSVMI